MNKHKPAATTDEARPYAFQSNRGFLFSAAILVLLGVALMIIHGVRLAHDPLVRNAMVMAYFLAVAAGAHAAITLTRYGSDLQRLHRRISALEGSDLGEFAKPNARRTESPSEGHGIE